MIASRIKHYTILDKLGEGGMGVVYRAEDSRLGRQVALKFLPSEITAKEENRQRFEQEARAAARLNHPNICTIHSSDEHVGRPFLVMEYVEGTTLREKIKSGPLPIDEALGYGVQITEALAEAHEAGIIHRDIKPANVLVDIKGRVKVMDFGLAKMKGTAEAITRTGSTVGTMAYMGPEQLLGYDVDHRADIFSFGVVFFELLTGSRPFRGEHEAALMYAIVNEEPTSLDRYLPEAPKALTRLFDRLLAKEPEHRIQTADELLSELRTIQQYTSAIRQPDPETVSSQDDPSHDETKRDTYTSGEDDSQERPNTTNTLKIPHLVNHAAIAAGMILLLAVAGYWLLQGPSLPDPPVYNSIAVMPLENLSPDPEDAFFADGMHEEIISSLSGIGSLTVIARSSVLGYAPEGRNFTRIGQELNVSSVMEGTVRRARDRIRVSVQLIDAGNQTTIWSGTYEDHVHDVFDIQSRIAREVAGALQVTLTTSERQRLEDQPTNNPLAYHFYIQGREYLSRSKMQSENPLAAEQLLRRALQEDPHFAHAWALLAVAYSDLYWFHGHTTDRLEKMSEAAEQAQLLAPDLAESELAIGLYYYWSDSDYERTVSYFESALQQFPNHPVLHQFTGMSHRRLGNWAKVETHLNRAIELDPRNSNYYQELSVFYYFMRDYDKAVTVINRLLEMVPDAHSVLRGLNALLN